MEGELQNKDTEVTIKTSSFAQRCYFPLQIREFNRHFSDCVTSECITAGTYLDLVLFQSEQTETDMKRRLMISNTSGNSPLPDKGGST